MASRALLDVNVLVALLDGGHLHRGDVGALIHGAESANLWRVHLEKIRHKTAAHRLIEQRHLHARRRLQIPIRKREAHNRSRAEGRNNESFVHGYCLVIL